MIREKLLVRYELCWPEILNYLTQHVTELTQITPEVSSILDLVIINQATLISGMRVEAPVHDNDHRTVIGDLNLTVPKLKAYKHEMWNFQNTNFEQFLASLSDNNYD